LSAAKPIGEVVQTMTNYLRNFVPGGCYFFTVNLAERRLSLLIDHIDRLRAAFRSVRARYPFTIDAIVVLPDHLHAIWTLPEGDADFSTRWRLIKSRFSRDLPRSERISTSRAAKSERGIWQRRYWEHTIRDDADYARHMDYIYFNPVKHGHVARVLNWPHSSFHRMVRLGTYPPDWAGDLNQETRHSASGDGFRYAQPILRTGCCTSRRGLW
jgi:putative transposase